MKGDAERDLVSIQYLRGIAALMIVLVHADGQLARMGTALGLDMMSAGVDIFFVISGFIMWFSTSRAPERTAGQFLRDRIVRIVPLYWAVTLFVAAVALLVPTAMQSTRFDPALLIASLFFIAWLNPSTGGLEPLVVVGWTLNLEMFFYLLFALAMCLSDRPERRFGLIVGMIVAVTVVAALLPGVPQPLRFYGDTIILEFAFGIALGRLWLNRRPRSSAGWWLVCLTGFVAIFAEPLRSALPGFLAVGVPAAMVVAGAVFAPTLRIAPLHALGDSSYALYLTHAIVLSVLAQLLRRAGLGEMPPMLFLLVAVATSVASGWMAFRLFERPLTQAAKRLLGGGTRRRPRAVLVDAVGAEEAP